MEGGEYANDSRHQGQAEGKERQTEENVAARQREAALNTLLLLQHRTGLPTLFTKQGQQFIKPPLG